MKNAFVYQAAATAVWIVVICIGNSNEPVRELPDLDDARSQAELLHEAMHSTLQIVHHRYYREDEGLPLPAAILKEVFAELEKEKGVSLRWLAIDGQAMNTDHRPRNDFEIEAAKALKLGRKSYEAIEPGIYRRAGAIRLANQCLKCHVPDRKSLEDRTAGLLITIPIRAQEESKQ